MNVIIENKQSQIDIDENINRIILNVIEKSIECEDLSKNMEISVVFVDNNEIREINRDFRGIDKATDVLSFPQYEDIYQIEDSEHEIVLGDIVISMEKAKEQCLEYAHSFERELAFLTVHSMYHLFGYDHDTEENTAAMREKEESVLLELGILR